MYFRHKQTKDVREVTGDDAKALAKDPEWDRIDGPKVDESQQMPPGVQPGVEPEPAKPAKKRAAKRA